MKFEGVEETFLTKTNKPCTKFVDFLKSVAALV